MRIKVDERIRTVIENGVKNRHRSMFIIVGDKSRDQIVNLHYMLSKSMVKSRPSVLWCYKNKLEISSHARKREKQIKKLMQRGLLDPEKVDAFSLFLKTGGITYCLYKDSERVLGQTFGMCILQDFESLTPNLLARTIETVEGGGLIVLLLGSLPSLTSLYTMVMDVHERFRTESHPQVTGRFNERFLQSLESCRACIIMDDELNILPVFSRMRTINPAPVQDDSEGLSEAERKLADLKEELKDVFPVGYLIKKCCTVEQGEAVCTFLDAILDKTLRSTVALLAARGRGKSSALGLAIAGAVAAGYSNIFVTAPVPENLKTLFEFICKGFDVLEYKEHSDYDVVKSTNPAFNKATVRINIYKQHRQTIQYIEPHEHQKVSQAELLVVDEAAAIPLPVVKSLLGPYLVFISSTVNGYEGTGRSLSLKLLQQLEDQSHTSTRSTEAAVSGRLFKKIDLSEPIRYASGDPIESWLHSLLCLDVANSIPRLRSLPDPDKCNLYYVNRDTIFSHCKDSEIFLQRIMALYVASHYKNSPNDLQLMADAPAHHLFVLLGPVDESQNRIPDILCVIQICLEGQISRTSAIKSLTGGHWPSGDQIPWKICEEFGDTVFPSLSGARIVRIATHPDAMRQGYGSRAVEQLTRYFEGQLSSLSEVDNEESEDTPQVRIVEAPKGSLLEERIEPRKDLPPLFVNPNERKPEMLHYIGVSFGLTQELFRFWRKHNFAPFFIGSVPSQITGEHSCMVLKPLKNDDIESTESDPMQFIRPFYQGFRHIFIQELSGTFRQMECKLAMSILDPKITFSEPVDPSSSSSNSFLVNDSLFMKRLEDYVNNRTDYKKISFRKNALACQYFEEKIPVNLSYAMASVLLCMGLQNKDITSIAKEMKVEEQQILVLYLKVMKKFHQYLSGIAMQQIESTTPYSTDKIVMKPHDIPLEKDLDDGAKQVQDAMRSQVDGVLNPEHLQQYAITDKEADFEKALQNGKISGSGIISVKSKKSKIEKHGKQKETQIGEKKRNKHEHSSKSNKKRKS